MAFQLFQELLMTEERICSDLGVDGSSHGSPLSLPDAYMPSALVFDPKGGLWTIGWKRDPANRDTELKSEYNIARKYSIASGKEIGQTLPRSMWAV